eukprot:scaffold75938_cov57-Phaeocystis_antarctica.AAC.2
MSCGSSQSISGPLTDRLTDGLTCSPAGAAPRCEARRAAVRLAIARGTSVAAAAVTPALSPRVSDQPKLTLRASHAAIEAPPRGNEPPGMAARGGVSHGHCCWPLLAPRVVQKGNHQPRRTVRLLMLNAAAAKDVPA